MLYVVSMLVLLYFGACDRRTQASRFKVGQSFNQTKKTVAGTVLRKLNHVVIIAIELKSSSAQATLYCITTTYFDYNSTTNVAGRRCAHCCVSAFGSGQDSRDIDVPYLQLGQEGEREECLLCRSRRRLSCK